MRATVPHKACHSDSARCAESAPATAQRPAHTIVADRIVLAEHGRTFEIGVRTEWASISCDRSAAMASSRCEAVPAGTASRPSLQLSPLPARRTRRAHGDTLVRARCERRRHARRGRKAKGIAKLPITSVPLSRSSAGCDAEGMHQDMQRRYARTACPSCHTKTPRSAPPENPPRCRASGIRDVSAVPLELAHIRPSNSARTEARR